MKNMDNVPVYVGDKSRMMTAELALLHDVIDRELTWIDAKWKVFIQLFSAETGNIEMFNDMAPAFFSVVQVAIVNDMVLSVSRLVDPPKSSRNENASIRKMIQLIEREGHLELSSKIHEKLRGIEPSLLNLNAVRNKTVAHLDFSVLASKDKSTSPQFKNLHFEPILAVIEGIMEDVALWYGFPTTLRNLKMSGDGELLVRYLKMAKVYIEKRQSGEIEEGRLNLWP